MDNFTVSSSAISSSSMPYKPNGWVLFIGISQIISGALLSLTILGAVLGVPMIFAGIRLNKGYKSSKQFSETGNPASTFEMIEHYHKYFTISGIVMLVQGALMIIYLLGIIIAVYFGFTEFLNGMENNNFAPKSFSPNDF